MMRPCVLLLLVLSALLCCGNARQVAFVGASLPNQIQPPQFLSTPSAPSTSGTNVAKCYGLARKSRSRRLQVPALYNSVSGQTAAVPDYLFSLDDRTIDRMEAEGWEVRMKTVLMPETFYQRVPVCCPWDAACYHNQQRGSQIATSRPAASMGPCTNGGVLATRGRAQVCVCPSGYRGVWCQTPYVMASSFPSGPVIPYGRMTPSTADIMKQAVKQAQIWREKIMSSKQPGVIFAGRPMSKRPLLSSNDHLISSINNRQWAQQIPGDKAMRMKMAIMMNLYLKQQAQRMRGLSQDRANVMGMPSQVQGPRTNLYSTTPSQTFVNPQMVTMINHLQGRTRMPTALNSYGPNTPQIRSPWDADSWEKQRGIGRGDAMMGGASVSVSREKLMALAFAQYMKNIQRQLANARMTGRGDLVQSDNMVPQINRRIPIIEPTVTDRQGDFTPMMDGINGNAPFQSDQVTNSGTGANPSTDKEMTTVELPRPNSILDETTKQQSQRPLNQENGPMTGRGMGHMTSNGPINSQQMPMTGINGQPMPQGVNPMDGQMLQGLPMGAGGPMPKMPSQEELQRMTECRVVLEPRISMCISDAGHDITLEQFMSPQYMSTAKGVCADSEAVGQCVMRQDMACGEGTTVEMTRKMIDSVLQMMGMVCGQIMRIEQQRAGHVSPVPGMPQSANLPNLATAPRDMNAQKQTDTPVGNAPTPTTVPPFNVHVESVGRSEAPPKSFHKFTTIGSDVTDKTPSNSASKSDKGHHSVEPVTSGSFIPGAPLWIVILVASIVLLIACLSLVLIALVIRKRRVEKVTEIERKAGPLDPKMFAIGIPPPNYATASIKTQDELSLPPLDLAEDGDSSSETMSCKEDSDGGDAEDDDCVKKPAISDDDADDESDDKEDSVDKKKKEKKDKK